MWKIFLNPQKKSNFRDWFDTVLVFLYGIVLVFWCVIKKYKYTNCLDKQTHYISPIPILTSDYEPATTNLTEEPQVLKKLFIILD